LGTDVRSYLGRVTKPHILDAAWEAVSDDAAGSLSEGETADACDCADTHDGAKSAVAGRALARSRAYCGAGDWPSDRNDQQGQGLSIVLVEQNANLALRLWHYVLENGWIALSGSGANLA